MPTGAPPPTAPYHALENISFVFIKHITICKRRESSRGLRIEKTESGSEEVGSKGGGEREGKREGGLGGREGRRENEWLGVGRGGSL